MPVQMFPGCCGLRILTGIFPVDPYSKKTDSPEERAKNWFMGQMKDNSAYGPVDTLAVLNEPQNTAYGKYLLGLGFELLTDKIFNPVHNWNTLYLYLWSASRNYETFQQLNPKYNPALPPALHKGE